MSEQLLLNQMIEKNIIKYGDFTLKSGEKSNVYINIKELNNYHNILSLACVLLYNKFKYLFSNVNLCGVPYGGISIATLLSNLSKTGIILLRKEAKSHGYNKMVDGSKDKEIIVIEDVVTTGMSVLESCQILEENGYKIKCILSIVYRGKETKKKILGKYEYNYLFSLQDIIEHSSESNIEINNCKSDSNLWNYFQYHNKKLLTLKEKKKSSIILAYDNNDYNKLLKLMEEIHPYIVGIKIHNEILELNYSENLLLYMKAKEYNLFLWEDRKFNDTGNTLANQIAYYESVRDYISIVPIGGESSLLELQSKQLGIFLLSELSTSDNMLNSLNTQQIIDVAIRNKAAGIICQTPENVPSWMITIMPGINISLTSDGLNQKWKDPRNLEYKPTFYVLGRAITNASNPVEELQKYLTICV